MPKEEDQRTQATDHRLQAIGGRQQGAGSRQKDGKIGHVEAGSLESPAKLLKLFKRAAFAGLIEKSEDGRFRIFAAAAHAARLGEKPEALFAHIVNTGRWLVISHEDEEQAAAMIRRIHH